MLTKPIVFISHTTGDDRDRALAHKLAEGLRERGALVWIGPDRIPPGSEWEPQIIQGINECTHFLVLLSAASTSAKWVLWEIGLARQRYTASRAPQILPLRLGRLGRFEGADFLSQFQEVPYRENLIAQVEAVAAAVGLRPLGRSPAPDALNPGKRFWIRRGKSLQLSFDGFLPDPEDKDWEWLNPGVVSFESISQFRCLVLLGEPGTGKSTALQAIYAELLQRSDDEESTRPLLVDLKECTSEALLRKYLFESAEFEAWRSSKGTLDLFLDSLDECLIHTQTVARNLVAELKRCPVGRLRLRIACRTAEWPELLSQELPALWGQEQYGDYEIAPLRRDDVAEAARRHALDHNVFLTAIKERDVVPLAIKPVTLNLLISVFKESNQLPGTLHALYAKGCERLCEDPSLDRAASRTEGKLPPAHRLKLAERIAAVTLLSKRPSIYLGVDKTRAPKECATLDDLSYGSARVGGKLLPVTHEHIRETLQTGLFTGGGGERLVTWSHWTFPEFLAARFLATGRFSTAQLKDLLLRPDVTGRLHVIPPLQETAAWLAGMAPAFLQELIPLAPEILLRSAAATSAPVLKAQLVDALLRHLDAMKYADSAFDLRRRYDVLKHPALGAQLLPYLRDRSKSVLARGTAINIAEECREAPLVEELVRLALDDSENLDIRCVSVDAVGVVEDRGAHEKLRPLLHVEGDPRRDLKARVLQVLWPKHLSAEALFESLTPPKEQNYYGTYSHFLGLEVTKHLKPEDLPVALRWVESKGNHPYFAHLVEAILRMAWTQLDAPQVLEQFVHICLARLTMHLPLFDVPRELSPVREDPGRRRALVRALLPHLGDVGAWTLLNQSLLSGDDLGWLLAQLEQATEPLLRERWLDLIARLFELDRLEHVELILEARQRIPELNRQFEWWLEAIELGSTKAKLLRQEESRRLRRMRPAHQPPAERRIRYLLDRFEAGDLTAWHRINLEWVRTRIEKRNRPGFDELRSDLTLLPVWNALGSELRARCIAAAERYLQEGDPHLSEWFGTGLFHRVAAAGYRALRLILEQRPAVIEGWPPELWTRWVPVVIDWSWSYGKEEEQLQQKEAQLQASFVKEAYVRAPEALLSAVRDWLDRRDPERSIYTLTRKLVDCWDTRLVETVLEHVRANTRLKASHLGVLLDEVIPRSQEAVNVALQLVSSGSDGDEAEEKKLEAARALLDKAPRAAWPQLWPIIEARPDFGEELIKRSVLYRLQSNELGKEFDEHSIADLYIWLERRFPPTDDKELKDFQLTGLLNRLLRELKQRGTEAAVSAVQRIAEALPDRGWLKLAVQQADEQRLRHEWQGIEPARLLEHDTSGIGSN